VLAPVRTVRRLGAALLAPVLLGGAGSVGLALLGPRAPAAGAAKPCVGVVVDGRLAGGDLRTACAVGDPDSGLAALTDAGFSYAFVPRQPGQVCQLDGFPECSRNSADTYWSYWWRAPGSSRWVYATEGAGSHDPDPGAVEAWVWQEGGKRQPPDVAFRTICPQAVKAPSTLTPAASPRPSTASGEPVPLPDLTNTPAELNPTAPTRDEPTSASAGPTTPAPTSTSASTTTAPSVDRSAPAAADDDSGDPPWTGLALGVGLVGLLGGAAFTRFRHTRAAP
jgi:hypothetical protein